MWLRDLQYELTDMDLRVLKAIDALQNPLRVIAISAYFPNQEGIKQALNVEKRAEDKQQVRRDFTAATGKGVSEALKTLNNLKLIDRDPTKGTYWLTDEGDAVLAQGSPQVATQMQDRTTARVKNTAKPENPQA